MFSNPYSLHEYMSGSRCRLTCVLMWVPRNYVLGRGLGWIPPGERCFGRRLLRCVLLLKFFDYLLFSLLTIPDLSNFRYPWSVANDCCVGRLSELGDRWSATEEWVVAGSTAGDGVQFTVSHRQRYRYTRQVSCIRAHFCKWAIFYCSIHLCALSMVYCVMVVRALD